MKKDFLILITYILIMSCSSGNKIIKENIIIPNEYEGDVYIFYNQSKVKGKVNLVGNTLTIFVPNDGIVFTKYMVGDSFEYKLIRESDFKMNTYKPIDGFDFGSGFIMDPNKFYYSKFYIGNLNKEQMDSIKKDFKFYKNISKVYEENR